MLIASSVHREDCCMHVVLLSLFGVEDSLASLGGESPKSHLSLFRSEVVKCSVPLVSWLVSGLRRLLCESYFGVIVEIVGLKGRPNGL
ncbi:unnamed protein product [Pylaiella littoralis]